MRIVEHTTQMEGFFNKRDPDHHFEMAFVSKFVTSVPVLRSASSGAMRVNRLFYLEGDVPLRPENTRNFKRSCSCFRTLWGDGRDVFARHYNRKRRYPVRSLNFIPLSLHSAFTAFRPMPAHPGIPAPPTDWPIR